MTERPWSKFYWPDWRSDPALRMCGIAARGLWMEMLSIMHEAAPRGSLLVNSQQVQPEQLANLAGIPVAQCKALWLELETAGVFSRDDDGTVYSRRMRREEVKSQDMQERGRKGGNPALTAKRTDKQARAPTDNQQVKHRHKPQEPEAMNQKDSVPAERTPPGVEPVQSDMLGEPEKDPAERARASFFSAAKPWLVEIGEARDVGGAGAFLAKQCRDFGDAVVIAVCQEAMRSTPASAKSWIVKQCQLRSRNGPDIDTPDRQRADARDILDGVSGVEFLAADVPASGGSHGGGP